MRGCSSVGRSPTGPDPPVAGIRVGCSASARVKKPVGGLFHHSCACFLCRNLCNSQQFELLCSGAIEGVCAWSVDKVLGRSPTCRPEERKRNRSKDSIQSSNKALSASKPLHTFGGASLGEITECNVRETDERPSETCDPVASPSICSGVIPTQMRLRRNKQAAHTRRLQDHLVRFAPFVDEFRSNPGAIVPINRK